MLGCFPLLPFPELFVLPVLHLSMLNTLSFFPFSHLPILPLLLISMLGCFSFLSFLELLKLSFLSFPHVALLSWELFWLASFFCASSHFVYYILKPIVIMVKLELNYHSRYYQRCLNKNKSFPGCLFDLPLGWKASWLPSLGKVQRLNTVDWRLSEDLTVWRKTPSEVKYMENASLLR